MKILIFTQKVDINDPILGFFTKWILEFSKVYDKVTVICLYKGKHNLPSSIEVLSLGKEEGVSKLVYVWRFYKYIFSERKKYDRVFVHMNQIYIILGGVFWKIWKKKIGLWYLHKSVTLSLKISLMITDVVFTGSKESFRIKSKKVNVVGQGVDTELFRPKNKSDVSNKIKILAVGRISPVKNFETLIDAGIVLSRLNQSDFNITIVGGPGDDIKDIEYLDFLKEKVSRGGIYDKVHFEGPVPNFKLPEFLSNSDIFVNPGGTGSLDKTGIEAMACGVPLLTSNEAYTDILKDYKEFMFKKGDSEELADKMLNLIKMDVKDRMDLGLKLRNIVLKGHDLEALVKKINRVYEKIDN